MTPADPFLLAPVGGKILHVSAAPGDMIRRDEPVVLILPDSESGQENPFHVMAWFAQHEARAVAPGQGSVCASPSGGSGMPGRVEEVLPPQTMPESEETPFAAQGRDSREVRGAALYVPVRIGLNAMPPDAPLGAALSCTVKTRSILGFAGL